MHNKISNQKDEFLWVEKYRPSKVEDCILPKNIKDSFADILKKNNIPNLLLSGSGGVGKSATAVALCTELDLDYIFINGSKDAGINTLRGIIEQFASSVSLSGSGKPKVVILDEADYIPMSTQTALRGFIEEFSKNCRFIFTCNFKNRILEQIHSRCTVIEFNVSKKNAVPLMEQFIKRLKFILDSENIEYNDKVLSELIFRFAPDWRRVINECQRFAMSGKIIDSSILSIISDDSFSKLIKHLKEKDFRSMRKWVVDNADLESTALFRMIYDNMYDFAEPTSIPNIVMILSDYQYKAAFVADSEINIVACMIELMTETRWKK